MVRSSNLSPKLSIARVRDISSLESPNSTYAKARCAGTSRVHSIASRNRPDPIYAVSENVLSWTDLMTGEPYPGDSVIPFCHSSFKRSSPFDANVRTGVTGHTGSR